MNDYLKENHANYMVPFLWMHGEDEPRLREVIGAIHQSGIGALCVESRPHPDFLGPKWWQDMDVVLDECKKRGMKIWILDDERFLTGYSAGRPHKYRRIAYVEAKMIIAAITFRLHAPWVHSLKEKRMVVKSLVAQLQNQFHVSAAEIDEQDAHQIIVIGVAAIVPHNAMADSLMDGILTIK